MWDISIYERKSMLTKERVMQKRKRRARKSIYMRDNHVLLSWTCMCDTWLSHDCLTRDCLAHIYVWLSRTYTYDSLAHIYMTVSRIYVWLSRTYTHGCLAHIYMTVSHIYIWLSRTYIYIYVRHDCLARDCPAHIHMAVSHIYIWLSRAYIYIMWDMTLSHIHIWLSRTYTYVMWDTTISHVTVSHTYIWLSHAYVYARHDCLAHTQMCKDSHVLHAKKYLDPSLQRAPRVGALEDFRMRAESGCTWRLCDARLEWVQLKILCCDTPTLGAFSKCVTHACVRQSCLAHRNWVDSSLQRAPRVGVKTFYCGSVCDDAPTLGVCATMHKL